MRMSLMECACGCGTEIEPTDKYGRPHTFVNYHQIRTRLDTIKRFPGSTHYNWKGGRRIGSDGYVLIYKPDHPRAHKRTRCVREHILVMEKHLGRYLNKGEVVHHINHVKTDNRIENLKLVESNGEHFRKHHQMNRDPNTGRFLSQGHKSTAAEFV